MNVLAKIPEYVSKSDHKKFPERVDIKDWFLKNKYDLDKIHTEDELYNSDNRFALEFFFRCVKVVNEFSFNDFDALKAVNSVIFSELNKYTDSADLTPEDIVHLIRAEVLKSETVKEQQTNVLLALINISYKAYKYIGNNFSDKLIKRLSPIGSKTKYTDSFIKRIILKRGGFSTIVKNDIVTNLNRDMNSYVLGKGFFDYNTEKDRFVYRQTIGLSELPIKIYLPDDITTLMDKEYEIKVFVNSLETENRFYQTYKDIDEIGYGIEKYGERIIGSIRFDISKARFMEVNDFVVDNDKHNFQDYDYMVDNNAKSITMDYKGIFGSFRTSMSLDIEVSIKVDEKTKTSKELKLKKLLHKPHELIVDDKTWRSPGINPRFQIPQPQVVTNAYDYDYYKNFKDSKDMIKEEMEEKDMQTITENKKGFVNGNNGFLYMIGMDINGNLCVGVGEVDGVKYKRYDKSKNKVVNLEKLAFDYSEFCRVIPTRVEDIVVGDILVYTSGNNPNISFVKSISKDKCITSIDLSSNNEVKIVPESFMDTDVCVVNKVVNLLNPGKVNYMLLAMDMKGDKIMDKKTVFMMMAMQNQNGNGVNNNLLPLLLMDDMKDDKALLFMMMSQQNGGNMNNMLPLLLMDGKSGDDMLKTMMAFNMMNQMNGQTSGDKKKDA